MTSNHEFPLEGTSVTLDCVCASAAVTANSAPGACTSDTIASYVWYKKDQVIAGASSKQYSLPGNSRSDSDDYKCQVTTANQNTHSSLQKTAVNKNVNFLCMLLHIFSSLQSELGELCCLSVVPSVVPWVGGQITKILLCLRRMVLQN